MKTTNLALVMVVLVGTACACRAATNDLTSLLQQGLFEEEANRNLDAAIANYQSLAAQFDKDRQVAATAVFRLGEVYRKLGKTNEAIVQYQRILRDFNDQQTLATLSRQNLTGLGAAAPQTSGVANGGATLDNLLSQYTLLKSQLEQARNETNLDVVASLFDDSLLRDRLRLLEQARGILKSYQAKPESPDTIQSAEANLRNSEDFVEAARKRLFDLQELRLNILQSAIRQAGAGQSTQMAGSRQNEAAPVTDDEEKEIRRIQQLIQNSPDLINAPNNDGGIGETPLIHAAAQGQLLVARYLLDHGANVNGRSRNQGSTPLYAAAENGHKAVVELLLSRGADVNAMNPLYRAVAKGFTSVVEVLLANNADVNQEARDSVADRGIAPLHAAAMRGYTGLIKLLVARGAKLNAKDGGGNTPLHSAAQSGQIATIKALLDAKADINARNKQGETPLLVSAEYGKSDAALALLAAGADAKLVTTAQGWMNISPLHFAVAAGDEVLTRALLERGADPNLAASPRPTRTASPSGGIQTAGGGPGRALETACEQDKPALVKILLEHGADPNVRRSDSMPLVEAFWFKPDVLQVLLDYKANPNATDDYGRTALHFIAMQSNGPTNGIGLLLEHGANVNAQAKNGKTPLYLAVEINRQDVAALLLAAKADPNIRNNQGQTPLDLAKASQSSGTIPGRIVALPPPPVRFGSPGSQLQPSAAPEINMAALLREHGALDNLPHVDRITLSRTSANYSETAFSKGTKDWNHFTLLEVLAENYGLINTSVSGDALSYVGPQWPNDAMRFPNLKAVVIHRPSPDGKSWKDIPANVAEILSSGDCSRDVRLEWGDVVEVPEADHPVSEKWRGLSEPEGNALIKCVSRAIAIKINNTNTSVTIAPALVIGGFRGGGEGLPVFDGRPLSPGQMGRLNVSFMVRSVLDQSKLIRFSSDLSNVKVTQRDAASGKTQSWVLDCSNPDNAPDLWLRDGDVIEVPEK